MAEILYLAKNKRYADRVRIKLRDAMMRFDIQFERNEIHVYDQDTDTIFVFDSKTQVNYFNVTDLVSRFDEIKTKGKKPWNPEL